MDLPFILDIAIGLIFVYLILSLLASEIQELIGTVLQWRAEHLKKSVDQLLTGDEARQSHLSEFVDELYRAPLMRSLNQEATGAIARGFRWFGQMIYSAYTTLTRSPKIFGEAASGPSYIPAPTFAAALIQKLKIRELGHKYSEILLRDAVEEKLTQIQSILLDLRYSVANDALFESEVEQLKHNLNRIIYDFCQQRRSLSQSLKDVTDYLLEFTQIIDQLLINDNHCKDIVRRRLPYLRQSVGLAISPPTLSEVVSLLTDRTTYDRLHPELRDLVDQALATTSPSQAQVALPLQLQRSLGDLARMAETSVDALEQSLEKSVQHLEVELSSWFDQSMERASGVYKRNAKGIALIIGVAIAYVANADTLYMIERLSQDSDLRRAIQTAAGQLQTLPSAEPLSLSEQPLDQPLDGTGSPTGSADTLTGLTLPQADASDASTLDAATPEAEQLRRLKAAVAENLDDIPLPIGRSPMVTEQQQAASQSWPVPILKRLVGWVLSGIAISMGAGFWYNLLGSVMRVRNTGDPPKS
ncbi:MAG: hypothetical protein IGR80_10755 [Synechococcales cyanobacterium K44_A2020_017]|nr:hypothetical protein [Synechococcales cyanobacterium K32_A2020_035]MBF2095222.1 hypothetical protein [Synechococcales cyanobacterium K44_A2020_017]